MKQSQKDSLKQQLQQHIQDVKLSESQFDELEGMMNSDADPAIVATSRPRWGALIAAVMFAAVAVTTFMMSPYSGPNLENIPQLIAEEVVSNHLKLKPLEIKAGSIIAIRSYLSKLEFMPVDSVMVLNNSMQLLGGRYCSLQGITAAQLRLQQGRTLQTLYQTQYQPEIFGHMPQIEKGEEPLVIYAKGIKVKIWVEKGLLFALTDSPTIRESRGLEK